MTIEDDFPVIRFADAHAVARDIEFFQSGSDIIMNRPIAARGHNEILGSPPAICRFRSRTTPEVTF